MALTRPKYSQIFDSDFKNSCRVATTAPVTLTGAAPNVVDSITLKLYDRVLVRAQTTLSQNGIYVVSVLGTGANGTWIRAQDASDGTRLTSGTTLSVEEGSTFGGKQFRMTTPNPINLGVSDITWVDVSGGGGAASGNDGQIQYNDNNAPGGATYLYYNKSSGQLKANATTTSTSTTTGALIVTGGVGISENLNIGANIAYGNPAILQSSSTITSIGTGAKLLDSFSTSVYRSAKYVLSVTDVTNTGYQTNEVILMQDGTNANITSYGILYSGTSAKMTFSSNVISGNVMLWGTGVSANNTVKLVRTLIPV